MNKASSLLVPLCAALTSCGDKWNLMPTPLVHQHIGARVYERLPAEQRSQDMQVFYATNRPSGGPPEARQYGNGIVEQLSLGRATVRLGEHGLRWNDLVRLSTAGGRRDKVPLTLGDSREIDTLPATDGASFAAEIDEVLASCRHPEITIYVHGARSTFLRSTVQGAQFHHFMARETALIAYSWPSTGKFVSYKKDVEYAAQSAANLADLIEYLAANTDARRINLLAYSAGGQVAAPALALLRDRHPGLSDEALRQKLRLGDVYFAAADVSLKRFATEYLPKFAGITGNVTVTYHKQDSVLKFAQRSHDGESRVGRPDGGELSEAEIAELEQLARQGKLDAIDMEFTTEERPADFKVHGHWYLNEWVSSDAILQFLYRNHASQRGLEQKPGTEAWYFPPDYPERLAALVEKERKAEAARR